MPDLKKLLKTTDRYIAILNASGIFTLKDLFNYFPKGHEDRQLIQHTFQDQQTLENPKDKQRVRVFVTEKKVTPLRSGKKMYEVRFKDEFEQEGKATYWWSAFVFQQIEKGKRYVIVGKPKILKWKAIFSNPEFILSAEVGPDSPSVDVSTPTKPSLSFDTKQFQEPDSYNIWRLYPIYSEMLGVKSWWFAKKIREVLPFIDQEYVEYLPEDFRREFGLADVAQSIKSLHYPQDPDDLKHAKSRIYFDRLLKVQLQSLINRQAYEAEKAKNAKKAEKEEVDWEVIKGMVNELPFQLTDAQKKVIKKVIEEFYEEKSILRLLQGDVGSGKTIVAAICAFYIIRKLKGQVAFLVPIEVLAIQHYHNLVKLFHPLGIQVRLLTGSVTGSQKTKIKNELKAGVIDIVIGTHAIIQDDVDFRNLQFVIIDEQHKFWVKQRSFFKQFGAPHILQMTATPIPRTLALAYFAEFEVSVIDQMPLGRKPIITKVVTTKEWKKLKGWILDRIAKGQSVFVVVPLINESENMEGVQSALTVFEEYKYEFSKLIWSDSIGLMHGKLNSKEKNEVMDAFKTWKTKILVSTTVIEVGVDVPHATIMIIKNAERFWLSQLHQLRGRVGRSDVQSYCFLETKNPAGTERLKAMEDHTDGFKLAEIDMQLRGTGEIMGYRQSGESDVPVEVLMDVTLIEKVQSAAHWLLEHYPGLRGLKLLESEIDYVDSEVMV
jgi:ATP-dependent DNA helicase RecG